MTNPESKPNSEPLPKDDQILIGPVRTRTSALALVHGLYASDIVLSWESKDDFEQLWRELKVEWCLRVAKSTKRWCLLPGSIGSSTG